MKRILAPGWDARRDYDAIVEVKRIDGQQELLGIRQAIHRAYDRYRRRARARELHRIHPLRGIDPTTVKLLEHCYDVETAALKELKQRLRNRLEESKCRHCPYCGFGEITTFDHYLPKSRFPELSVCADNLIPCCWRCNHLRGDRDWVRGRGPAVIHVVYERIDESDAFLGATFDIEGEELVVAFCVNEDDTKPFSGRFKQHFEVLDLAKRFETEAAGEIEELLDGIGTALETLENNGVAAAALIEQHCRARASAKTKRQGANHWKAAFYRAAATSHTLVEYLVRQGGRS